MTFGSLEVGKRAEKFVKKPEEREKKKRKNSRIVRIQGETVKPKPGEKER